MWISSFNLYHTLYALGYVNCPRSHLIQGRTDINPGSLDLETKLKIIMLSRLYKCSVSEVEEMIGYLNFAILEIPCYFKLNLLFCLSQQSVFISVCVSHQAFLVLSGSSLRLFSMTICRYLWRICLCPCVLLSSILSSFTSYMLFFWQGWGMLFMFLL